MSTATEKSKPDATGLHCLMDAQAYLWHRVPRSSFPAEHPEYAAIVILHKAERRVRQELRSVPCGWLGGQP